MNFCSRRMEIVNLGKRKSRNVKKEKATEYKNKKKSEIGSLIDGGFRPGPIL